MTILQNRRTVFSLTNTDVMSSAAPSSEAGIEKSVGQDGFFIYTSKAFDLWFKDANGAWSLYDSYGLADITDGVAFSWNTNTAAFIQTQEASHQVAIFIIETKTVGSFGNQEQTNLSSAGLDRLKEHSNYKRIRMQNSGHTGEAYAIAIFDTNGDAAYVSAPVSGEREGKVLGWDENGDLGWITLETAASFTTFGDTTETDGVYSLDGSGDYVTYDGDHQYTDQFSISVWFKSDGASNPFDVIVSNHDGGNIANGNAFSLYPNGKLRIKTADSGTGQSGDAMNVGSNLDDNSWHQLVVTWQANTTNGRSVYIDGSLVNQSNTGTAVYRSTPQSLMYLGGMWIYTTNSFSGNGFEGDITGFSIVNSILTAQQVSDSYVADIPPVTVVAPSLYFDGSSTSSQIGSNSVSFTGGSALTTSNGKYDSAAFDFGTSGNKSMLLSTGLVLDGTYTFSAWFYNKRSNNHGAFIKKNTAGTAGAQYPILSHLVDGDELGLHNGTFRGTGYSMSSLEGLAQWTHIAVVANGSDSTFYINGQQVGNVVSHVITATVQRIGGYSANDQTFAEALDEFAYWDSALTAGQIATIYNSSDKLSVLAPETMPETSFDNAQSSGVLYQGATNVNGMYIDNNTRGQGYLKGDWDASMRPDNSSDDFSFSAFWRFKAANSGDRSWVFGRNGSVSSGGWGIFATKVNNTSIKYEIVKSGGNPWFQTAAITTTVLDEFHHVAFRYRDGEWFIYHDGVEVYTTTNKNFPTTNPSSGKYTIGNGWAVVMLDQIQFFKGGYLTTDQISSLASERSQKDIDYTNNT